MLMKKPCGPWESVSEKLSKLENALGKAKHNSGCRSDKEHRVVWDQIEVDAAFMNSSIFLFIVTEDNFVHRASQNALDFFGWTNDSLRGQDICSVLRCVNANQDDKQCSSCCIETILENTFKSEMSETNRSAKLFQSIGGESVERDFYITSVPLTIGETTLALLSLSDVTAWKCIQNEANKVDSMDAIGRLAGGIAHDFNNILSVILGKTAMIQICEKSGDPPEEVLANIRAIVRDIEVSTLHAADLSNELLSCSRGGAPVKTILNLVSIVNKASARSLTNFSSSLELAAPDNLWPIEADATQLEQAIRNILINSAESMEGKGQIKAEAENLTATENTIELLQPGNYVHLTISDEGMGIAQKNLPRVFEPYFSTKTGSRGLGLTPAYAILKRHGGDLSIASHEGKGTVVHLYIPAYNDDLIPVIDELLAPIQTEITGDRHILVVDDNPGVREVAIEMLQSLGLKTSSAPEGRSALDLYTASQKNGDPIHGVILDLTMPNGMDGRETMRGLLKLDENVRVIVSSGYNNDPIMAKFWEYGFCAVLPKPYSFIDLKRVLSKI